MIVPRVLFLGDPSAAIPYVGIAKKLARECYRLKIANRVYQLGAGIKIRVENRFPIVGELGRASKVWIEAKAGLHGFQFIYSGEIADYRTGAVTLAMQGSAVWVPLSRIEYKNGVWTLPDWSVAVPKATGSTVEVCPGKTELDSDVHQIQKVDSLVQVNLVPEPSFRLYSDVSKPPVCQVVTAWNATEGEIHGLGAFAGTYYIGSLTDIGYDMHPSPVRSTKPKMRAPESDWPDNSGAQIVTSEAYGSRRFLVLVDGSGTFHCWPDQYDTYEDLTPSGTPYVAQSYRVNVPAGQVKTAQPPYPEWAHQFPSGFARRDSDFPHPDMVSSEPRYVWRYSPDGKKVVGHLLNREDTVYTVRAMDYGTIISAPYDLMTMQTDVSAYDGGATTWHDVVHDVPGWAEFSLDIAITGEALDDFEFSITLLRHEVAGDRYPIAVGYVGPCYLGWESRGVEVSPGDLVMLDMRVYTGPDTEQQIEDMAGVFTGVHSDSTNQVIVAVYNIDTDTDVMTFTMRDVPDGHYINRFAPDSMSEYEYWAKFLHIDLSTLSFVIRAEYDSLTKGGAYYSFTTNDGTLGSGVQRWMEEEVGIRAIVYGKLVHEERNGGEFGALDKLDTGVVEGYTKLALDKKGCRRIYNSRIGLWSAADLLSSFCYLMAKYLPTNAQPDPLYDKNDPCASWTDHWGVTRTTTLSFIGEVAPAVRGELPGTLTDINSAYTTEYWDTYIVPKAWEIYTTTQAMRVAGDTLPNRNNSSAYRHAQSVYRAVVFQSSDINLKSWSSSTINHHVDDYAIGKEAYGCMWEMVASNDARFALQVSWDGYYSLWIYDRYVADKVPHATFHIATTSQKPMVRTEIALTHLSVSDSQYSKANKPSASQFKFTNTGFISHILSDTQLQHAELYGTAYETAPAMLHDPEVSVADTGYTYYYTTKQDVKVDGLLYGSSGYFYSYAHNIANPVLVGSAYFIDY